MILDSNSVCGLIDNNLATLIHTIISILKFGIPLLLIVFGMLDFSKGVIASKEDEIKSGQKMFFKRVISAVLVFFVVTIVQLVIGIVDDKNDSGESDAWNCANLILNGKNQNSNTNNNSNNNNSNNNNSNNNNNSSNNITDEEKYEIRKKCCQEASLNLRYDENGVPWCITGTDTAKNQKYSECYQENISNQNNNSNDNSNDDPMKITELQSCCIEVNGIVTDDTRCKGIPNDTEYNKYIACIAEVYKKY